MSRLKTVDYSHGFLAVVVALALLPGAFEYAPHHLLDHRIDLSEIESRHSNDEAGASTYEPQVPRKIVLLCDSHGVISSRSMVLACRNNV
jgi:hypothetical protein